MATHSSVLVWRIPGTGKPDGLPSMGSHRVGHNCRDLAAAAEWRKDFFFFYFHSFSLSSFLLLEIIKHVYWLIPSFGSHWSALCHMAMLSFKGGWKSTGRVAEVIKGKRKWEPLVSCQNARICSKYFFWSLFLPSFQDFECVPFLSTKIEKWMKWEQYTLQGLLCWDRGLVFLVGPPTNMKWMAPWEG